MKTRSDRRSRLVQCAFAGVLACSIAAADAAPPPAPPPLEPSTFPGIWFEPYQKYEGMEYATSVVIADVTGDRRNDVVMTSSFRGDYRLFVYPQTGRGSLGPARSHRIDTLNGGTVDAWDVNRDGIADAAAATSSGVDIYYGGRRGLSKPVNALRWPYTLQVQVRDLNRDRRADFIIGSNADDPAKGGTFVLIKSRTGFSPRRLHRYVLYEAETGDVNGDGRLDVVGLANRDGHAFTGGNLVIVCLQRRRVAFACRPVDSRYEYAPSGLEVADVTGDRRADIAVTARANTPHGRLIVIPQTAQGRLAAPMHYFATDGASSVEAGDIDGNGRLDLVVAHNGFSLLGVFRQKLDGRLDVEEVHEKMHVDYDPRGIAAGDVSGDRRADVVYAADGDLFVARHVTRGRAALSLGLVSYPPPRPPTAGQPYEVRMVVERRWGALKDRSNLRVGCVAAIEGRPLPVAAKSAGRSAVMCRWNIPATARGKGLAGSISALWRKDALTWPHGNTVR